jgi:hypothetical protein
MDASELATKMLEWEKNKRALDALGSEIEAEVLKLGKTQVVGKCRVTFRNGTASYDYKTPALTAPSALIDRFATPHNVVDWDAVADEVPEVVAKFTTVEMTVDYKAVLKEAKLEPLVVSRTDPTATIKLED